MLAGIAVLHSRCRNSIISWASKPFDAAVESEFTDNLYSWMYSGRQTGSAKAIRNAWASLWVDENDSNRIWPSGLIHNGQCSWFAFNSIFEIGSDRAVDAITTKTQMKPIGDCLQCDICLAVTPVSLIDRKKEKRKMHGQGAYQYSSNLPSNCLLHYTKR